MVAKWSKEYQVGPIVVGFGCAPQLRERKKTRPRGRCAAVVMETVRLISDTADSCRPGEEVRRVYMPIGTSCLVATLYRDFLKKMEAES